MKDAQKLEAKAAQRNQKTQSLGNQHEALLKQRDGLQDETDRLKKNLAALRIRKTSQEDLLRKTEKTRALLEERSHLQDEINSAGSRLKEKEDRRKELLTVAWKGLLDSRIQKTRDSLEEDLKNNRDAHQRVLVSIDMEKKLRKALDDGECSTCGQKLSEPAKAHLTSFVSAALPKEEYAQLEANIQHLESRIGDLKQSEASSNTDVLQEVQDTIDELKIKRATAQDRLIDIKEQTKDLDEAEMRRLYSEFERRVWGARVPNLDRSAFAELLSGNSRAWIAFHCFPESLKVIGDGLAELVELGEEILGAGKLHGQIAGLELDPRGEALEAIGGLGAQGDGDGGGLAVFTGLVDLNHNPLVAHRLQ